MKFQHFDQPLQGAGFHGENRGNQCCTIQNLLRIPIQTIKKSYQTYGVTYSYTEIGNIYKKK